MNFIFSRAGMLAVLFPIINVLHIITCSKINLKRLDLVSSKVNNYLIVYGIG